MKTKTNYTPEQTAQFKLERNNKRDGERVLRKQQTYIHVSQKLVPLTDPKTGEDLGIQIKSWNKGKTFVGSVRKQSIGIKRNNVV
jgi:hypothetical protein